MFKTSTTYNPYKYFDTPLPYSLRTNTATQFLGQNLLRNLLGILHTRGYCVVWAIFKKLFESSINAWILIPRHIYYLVIRLRNHIILLVMGEGGIEIKKTCSLWNFFHIYSESLLRIVLGCLFTRAPLKWLFVSNFRSQTSFFTYPFNILKMTQLSTTIYLLFSTSSYMFFFVPFDFASCLSN